LGLAHERARLAAARQPGEIASRKVWVAQREKEIDGEIAFLAKRGLVESENMTDDELIAALCDR
jgi:hypothetical protein